METEKTPFDGVLLVSPNVFGDARGFFLETHHADRYGGAGFPRAFVQDNLSRSLRGTLRGLHFQLRHPQGKLVYVVRGEIFDVVADIRRGSPRYGQWFGVTLSDENHRQIYVPPGYAHGFQVVSECADVIYKCTELYHPDDEGGVVWNDDDLAIRWPLAEPILSAKDARYARLRDHGDAALPRYVEFPTPGTK
ncbi:MAG: dTDP-4-dehydrorhamnose 3,5-epimerase [Planctomycetes bacterium]|nr:dTDP-4-dehydrorhamnose 3,5-epimerase [Planctomycetota bacterium]